MHDQLLQQARRLARLDPKRPRQSNLRRAASTAYYAAFHFLVDQACRAALGTQHNLAPYRQVLGRAFEHTTMKNACLSHAGGTLKANVAKGLPPGFSIPVEVRRIARIFVLLQDLRHAADYDLTERFNRANVLTLVEETEDRIRDFRDLAVSNEKKFFLAFLWAWKNLVTR